MVNKHNIVLLFTIILSLAAFLFLVKLRQDNVVVVKEKTSNVCSWCLKEMKEKNDNIVCEVCGNVFHYMCAKTRYLCNHCYSKRFPINDYSVPAVDYSSTPELCLDPNDLDAS